MEVIFEEFLAVKHPNLTSPLISQIDHVLKIRLLQEFKNLPELKGLELWLSKFLRGEVLKYLGATFVELQDLLQFIFSTDFKNWDELMTAELEKNYEQELLIGILGQEKDELAYKC